MDLKSLMNNDGGEGARVGSARPPPPPPPPQPRDAREWHHQQHQQGQQQGQQHQAQEQHLHQHQAQDHNLHHYHHQQHQHQQQRQQQQHENNYRPQPRAGRPSSNSLSQNPYGASASRPAPPLYPQQSPQQPQHSNPSADPRPSNGSLPPARPILTPLMTPTRTPSQTTPTAAYPFPAGPYQSPSQPSQYRSQDPHQPTSQFQPQATTPGGSRPPPPLYPQQYQTAQGPYGPAPGQSPALRSSGSHPSMSPTLPDLHHQAPPPARESSLSATHPYPHQPYSSHQYQQQHPQHHQSQPVTPLGPPSSANRQILHSAPSPYAPVNRNRSSSGASYSGHAQSMASNSPASAYPSESPAPYGATGQIAQPRRQQSGSYVADHERDRSLSVSPKTQVLPRTSSQSSYHSNQDVTSNRGSVSAPQPEHDRPSHQIPPLHEPQQSHLRSSGDISTIISPPFTASRQQTSSHAPIVPSPSSRSSQTPLLRNILNDTGPPAPSTVKSSPALASSHDISPATPLSPASIMHNTHHKKDDMAVNSEPATSLGNSLLQQPVAPSTALPAPNQDKSGILKRAAESTPESTHPVKRAKKRYAEPPIWARFAKSNPKYGDNAQSQPPPPHQLQQAKKPSPFPPSRAQPPQANGHAGPRVTNGTPTMIPGNLPLNNHPRLGPWEYNIKNLQPMNDFVKEIGDFLFVHATRNDIGTGDLRSGALEIEAKLGTLIDKQSGMRVATMGRTNMVLDPAVTRSGRIRFESFMTELQHKQMNEFLNKAVQASMEPHRVKMGYKHRYEKDSFAPLNRAGYEALPPSAKAHIRPGQSLRLRTTIPDPEKVPKDTPSAVLGRIVKIRLEDLDILCPRMDFDCRISVNVEVDLNNRPDIDPALIVDEPNPNDAEAPQSRRKDRLSYQHLAYSVDLTQVILTNGDKSHELEIEIDSARLREEAIRLQQGLDSGYEMIVEGFLSNMITLMKAQKAMSG